MTRRRLLLIFSATTLMAVLTPLGGVDQGRRGHLPDPVQLHRQWHDHAAGRYTVSTDREMLFIRGISRGVIVRAMRAETTTDTTAKLVFEKYGGESNSAQGGMGGRAGRELPVPRTMRDRS